MAPAVSAGAGADACRARGAGGGARGGAGGTGGGAAAVRGGGGPAAGCARRPVGIASASASENVERRMSEARGGGNGGRTTRLRVAGGALVGRVGGLMGGPR